ncbi:hypothetical protein [Aliivibrio fischeri]|uniref:hypothetical protein n=1 Tax=Aliivibrio fischeri TaxID=668 RepID=UPI0007C49C92|nr:hypothetical protein [Aliivibrio fischeri]
MKFHIQMKIGTGSFFKKNHSNNYEEISLDFLSFIKEMEEEGRDVKVQLYYDNKVITTWAMGDCIDSVASALLMIAFVIKKPT